MRTLRRVPLRMRAGDDDLVADRSGARSLQGPGPRLRARSSRPGVPAARRRLVQAWHERGEGPAADRLAARPSGFGPGCRPGARDTGKHRARLRLQAPSPAGSARGCPHDRGARPPPPTPKRRSPQSVGARRADGVESAPEPQAGGNGSGERHPAAAGLRCVRRRAALTSSVRSRAGAGRRPTRGGVRRSQRLRATSSGWRPRPDGRRRAHQPSRRSCQCRLPARRRT